MLRFLLFDVHELLFAALERVKVLGFSSLCQQRRRENSSDECKGENSHCFKFMILMILILK